MHTQSAYRLARLLKQSGISISNWPIFTCKPLIDSDQKESISKSIDRHRRNNLRLTKDGRISLKEEEFTRIIIRKVFDSEHV